MHLDNLNLSNDLLFSALLQQKDFCQAVLKIILERDLVAVEYHQVEKSFRNLPGYKSIRLDVYAQDEKGGVYNVEMQTAKKGDLAKRARYYQGMLDVSGLLSGKSID